MRIFLCEVMCVCTSVIALCTCVVPRILASLHDNVISFTRYVVLAVTINQIGFCSHNKECQET